MGTMRAAPDVPVTSLRPELDTVMVLFCAGVGAAKVKECNKNRVVAQKWFGRRRGEPQHQLVRPVSASS